MKRDSELRKKVDRLGTALAEWGAVAALEVNSLSEVQTLLAVLGDMKDVFDAAAWMADAVVFGGVAIQADPCEECRCTAIDPDGSVGPDFGCSHARCHERGGACHGLGVIPRHGSIEWRCEWLLETGGCTPNRPCDYGDKSRGRCRRVLVVPIEGDE